MLQIKALMDSKSEKKKSLSKTSVFHSVNTEMKLTLPVCIIC